MGYTVPGADFTAPSQLQTNVGAEVGKSLGNVFAQFGAQLRQANEQAQKTSALQTQMKDTILINNTKSVNKTLSAGKEQFGDDEVLYNEWKNEVVRRGEEATQAQIDFQFGDLDAASKKAKLDIVGGFESYLTESKQNYGRFLADVNDIGTDGMRIIGDTTNGEQQSNQIILNANSGGSAEDLFGKGATMTRSLSGDNKEIINTRVRIPVNSPMLKTLGSKSNGTSISVFEKGVEEGIIKKNVGEDGMEFYEFDKKIDTSRYSKKGGFDFVIPKDTAIDGGATAQELGYADENMIIKPDMFAKMNVGVAKETVDGADVNPSAGEPAVYTSTSTKNSQKGYVRTINSSIINVAEMRNDPALGVIVNSKVKGMLLSGRGTDAKLDSFGAYGVDSLDAFPALKNKHKTLRGFIESGDEDALNTFTKSMVTQTVFDKLFSKTDNKGDRVYTQMTTDPKMVEFLNANNIRNEANEPYEVDQTVYVKNEITERLIQKDAGPDFNEQMKSNLGNKKANLESLFAVAVQIPGPAKSKVAYFPAVGKEKAGVYRIDDDGAKGIGATPMGREFLLGLF
tara:strand:- start:360 stop:2063 length:1704 start_codon:yes stop_codon:yes gene_type:complete